MPSTMPHAVGPGPEHAPANVDRRSFHTLRHSCATYPLNAGVALEVVSKILGHSGIAITADIYASVTEKLTRPAQSKPSTEPSATDTRPLLKIECLGRPRTPPIGARPPEHHRHSTLGYIAPSFVWERQYRQPKAGQAA